MKTLEIFSVHIYLEKETTLMSTVKRGNVLLHLKCIFNAQALHCTLYCMDLFNIHVVSFTAFVHLPQQPIPVVGL